MAILAFNYLSLSLVLVPTLFNVGILMYLYFYLPKNKLTNFFSLFLVALMFWQIGEIILRLDISLEQAIFWDQVFSVGSMAIGPLVVHFACMFTGLKIINHRPVKFAIYFSYLFFFSDYHANPAPKIIHHHNFWGYILGIRPDSFDLAQRIWLAGMVLTGITILAVFAFSKELEPTKRKQTLLIIAGLLIPTLQGFVTQILFPYFGTPEIPITTTLMTFFSIFTIVALSKYKLFDPYDSIDVKGVFNAVNSMVMIFSPDLNSKYFNPEANKKLRINGKFNTSFHIKELFSGDEKNFQSFLNEVIDRLQNGEKVPEYETVFTMENGHQINILLSGQPVLNNRKTQFLLLVCHDITSRVIAEKELIQSNERYYFVTKATNEAIRDWNIEQDIMIWEEGIEALFGLKQPAPDNSLENWESYLHPSDRKRMRKNLKTVLLRTNINQWNAEYRFMKNDGTYAFVDDKAFIVRDGSGKAIRLIGALRDITHQKEYLKAIESKNKQLKEISWIQSHKVRAPLANVMGLVSILMEQDLQQEESQKYLQCLKSASSELDNIIRTVVSKAELAEYFENVKNGQS